MLNLHSAQQALLQHSNNNAITPQDVETLLQATRGVTFARIAYVTPIATAAAHKHNAVQKVTVANVQLFNNLKAFTDVYTNAVKRSAAQIATNSVADVEAFTKQDNYFTHTNCFSLVQHKLDAQKYYLYAIYNTAESMYFINAQPATKQQVAALLTASAATKLLEGNALVHNVANNVTHTVQVRTIALQNIVSITAHSQTVAV